MKKYLVHEFRKKLKEAFDLAEMDEEVFINRDGTFFKVSLALNQERLKDDTVHI